MTARFIINEATCYHGPPSRVLDVGIVGDMAFLAICDNNEVDSKKTETVIREEIAVDVNTLYNALKALASHNERAAERRSSVEEKNCCQEPPKKSRKKG